MLAGTLEAHGIQGGQAPGETRLVEGMARESAVGPEEIFIQGPTSAADTLVLFLSLDGQDLHQRSAFVNGIGIGDVRRDLAPDNDQTLDAFRGDKFHVHPSGGIFFDVLLQDQAGFGLDFGVFHLQDQVLLVFPDGEDATQQGHILGGQGDIFSHCLEITSAGEIGQIIPEHEEVGDFTGHGYSLKVGMVKSIHPQGRETIQVGGARCLQRGLATKNRVAVVSQAVQDD